MAAGNEKRWFPSVGPSTYHRSLQNPSMNLIRNFSANLISSPPYEGEDVEPEPARDDDISGLYSSNFSKYRASWGARLMSDAESSEMFYKSSTTTQASVVSSEDVLILYDEPPPTPATTTTARTSDDSEQPRLGKSESFTKAVS